MEQQEELDVYEIKIQEIDEKKECSINGTIEFAVDELGKIDCEINLKAKEGECLNQFLSRCILNTDSSNCIDLENYKYGHSLSEITRPYLFSFRETEGVYFIHVLITDMHGNSRQIVSGPIIVKNLSGIFEILMKQTNSHISKEIRVTASSIYDELSLERCPICSHDLYKNFVSDDKPNNWLNFEFKNHRIIPTSYIIRTNEGGKNQCHLKSWVIEVSNNNNSWEIIDEEKNVSYLNGSSFIHKFSIQKQISEPIKYIRIRSTGEDWGGFNYLAINLFEIYGTIY